MAAIPARRGGELSGAGAIHDRAARGFGSAAEEYERGRPEYPSEATRLLATELAFGPGSTVVDLAAGTGKLTRALILTGARVIAVEPLPAMRAQLERAVPTAEAREGTAEAIPVADASADALLVAQAFHWFDVPAAAREIHRVLRPGGGLGIIYNEWDERVDWVARLDELVGAYRGDTPQGDTSPWREKLAATGLFTPLAHRALPNVVHGSLEILLAHVASISVIAVLPERERSGLLDEVRALVIAQSALGPNGELAIPYTTHITWCHAVAAPAP